MNHWPDETDEEVASLTTNNNARLYSNNNNISNHQHHHASSSSSCSAPLPHINNNHLLPSLPTNDNTQAGRSVLPSPPAWNNSSLVNVPPTPGDFYRTPSLGGAVSANPLTNGLTATTTNTASRLTTEQQTLRNPLGVGQTAQTSTATSHLDPNPDRILQNHTNDTIHQSLYSNYESIMSSLGSFSNRSYGQVSRMNVAGWEEREREMCRRFELGRWGQQQGQQQQQEQLQQGLGGLQEMEESELKENANDDIHDGVLENNTTATVTTTDNQPDNYDGILFDGNASFEVDDVISPPPSTLVATTTTTTTTTNFVPETPAPGTRRTVPLQEWIVLHRPPNLSSCPVSQRHVYLQKVTVLFHALISKILLAKKKMLPLNGSNDNDGTTIGSPTSIAIATATTATTTATTNDTEEEWDPHPNDLSIPCITLTEIIHDDHHPTSPQISIEGIEFNTILNFNWEDPTCGDETDEDVRLLHALGRLWYELCMEGEENQHHVVLPSLFSSSIKNNNNNNNSNNNRVLEESKADDDDSDGGIMEMLRILSENEVDREELFCTLKDEGALPTPLCRLICDMGNASSSGNTSLSLTDVWMEVCQMMESPKAFLFGTITSRWELVFGNNHVFGRKKELGRLMDAASRVVEHANDDTSKKEAILISGHAGSGKSSLVQEIRKPLKAKGWTFLRCKFEKTIQSEPLSVVALGLDEFFLSTMPCFPSNNGNFDEPTTATTTDQQQESIECTCDKASCPRKVIRQLHTLVGLDGIKALCRWMPCLMRLAIESYPVHSNYFEDGASSERTMLEQDVLDMIRLLGVLLEVVAAGCPVLFFADDLQWADVSTISLLTGLISIVGSSTQDICSNYTLLFLGACRIDDSITKEVVLNTLLQGLEKCDDIALDGFDVRSLNELMSEVLCLPCRKTRSLSEAIHDKTLGMPLFVVELVDTLLAEELLTESDTNGWEWDIDAIHRKPIAEGVATLLSTKLESLPPDAIRGLKIISCFESRLDFQGVDLEVIETIKKNDANDSVDISAALEVAAENFLVNISGTTVAFSHELIQKKIFDLIPIMDRIPILHKLITCLVAKCQVDSSAATADVFVLATVNLMNKIGSDYMTGNPQSHLFAEYNLQAGRIMIDRAKFTTAIEYLRTGMLYLQGNGWDSNYYLTVGFISNMVAANYAIGNPEECFAQANQIFERAATVEDKFTSYCVYIKLLGVGSTDQAIEKILYLLPFVGEGIDPNAINQQVAMDEMMALRQTLSGSQKDMLLQLSFMSDSRALMSIQLMGLLVLYSSHQKAFLSGWIAARMIRLSLQYGQCEDTVYALSVFSSSLVHIINDVDEAYALAQVTISMIKNYNMNKLIPRVNGLLYGTVLPNKHTVQSTLGPLSNACRLASSQGIHEHAIVNTLIYVRKSISAGTKLPVLLNEIASLTQQHEQLNQTIIKHFLAPTYNVLSILSGIVLDEPKVLSEFAKEPTEDIVATAIAENELIVVRAAVQIVMFEALILRDFAKAAEMILNYSQFFELAGALELNLHFMAGLVSLHMARLTRESHWAERGTKMLAAYERWSVSNPSNYEHKYLLLKAEYHQLKGETEAAINSYEASMDSAQHNHFTQNEAIACEMATHHFANIGDKKKTKEMIQKTHDVYIKWGAKAKAASVLELLNLRYLDEAVLTTN